MDVVSLHFEKKNQTQKGDEKGGMLITMPEEERGLSQQSFTY